MYVNGVLEKTISQTGTTSTGTMFGIGRDPDIGTEYWDGSIDEVRVYSRALSSGEVEDLFASTNSFST